MLTEDNAHDLLQGDYFSLLQICSQGYATYRDEYPNKTRHRRSTRASIVCDEMLGLAVQEFDGRAEISLREVRGKNLRFLKYSDSLLLWFKKVDKKRTCRTFPTEHAKDMQDGLFADAAILIVGHLLSNDETKVSRVSILCPGGYGKVPKWYIDLEQVDNVVKFPTLGASTTVSNEKGLVRVTRSSQAKLIS